MTGRLIQFPRLIGGASVSCYLDSKIDLQVHNVNLGCVIWFHVTAGCKKVKYLGKSN